MYNHRVFIVYHTNPKVIFCTLLQIFIFFILCEISGYTTFHLVSLDALILLSAWRQRDFTYNKTHLCLTSGLTSIALFHLPLAYCYLLAHLNSRLLSITLTSAVLCQKFLALLILHLAFSWLQAQDHNTRWPFNLLSDS
jgi:uncharacterized membrane protein YjgN (DUF898 family)